MMSAAAVAAGALIAGCSGGGSSGGGYGGGGAVVPGVDPVGPLTSALPVVNRDASYSYTSFQVNNIQGSGTVTALGAASVGTNSVAIHAPLNQITRLAGTEAIQEDSLAARATSIASTGTLTVAATGDQFRSGSGDVYQRREINNRGSWSILLDTNASEATVAAVGSDMLALIGGEDTDGVVYQYGVGGIGSFTQIASLGSRIGTAAVRYDGQTYVGGMENTQGGGGATLQRLVGASAIEIDLPFSGGGNGVRQMVTAMMAVDYASVSATSSDTEVLIMAIGSFDRSVNVGLGGIVVATDGVDFEIMQRFEGEAPTALAFADNTIYVATDGGKLQYRDGNGDWIDEPSLPAGINGIHSLLARDASTFQIGAAGTNGAIVFVRHGGGAAPNPTADTFYVTDIKPILTANNCTTCHTSSALVQPDEMLLSANLADDAADHQEVRARVDLGNAAMSELIRKSTGAVSHTGGAVIVDGSADYNTMIRWIEQGAVLQAATTGGGGGTTPPPTSNFVTFVDDVAPILAAANCNSCHDAGSGRILTLLNPADATADFNAFRAQVDPVNPAASVALRHATQQEAHPIMAFAVGSAQYDTIVDWINDGRRFQ